MFNCKLLSTTAKTELTSAIADSVDIDTIGEALSGTFRNSGTTILISLVLFLILCVILISSSRSKKKKQKSLRDELNGYLYRPEEYQYSGTISIFRNQIQYSRGNRSVSFDIQIEKETILAPFMVDPWFENRNYNYREALIILNDISNYLKVNKYCKSVTVTTDEAYEDLISEVSATEELSDE